MSLLEVQLDDAEVFFDGAIQLFGDADVELVSILLMSCQSLILVVIDEDFVSIIDADVHPSHCLL